jgi:hypothetical protein
MDIKYDYASVPTIRRFSRSTARIRGLMGPFGSGKSSGCVIDILRMGQQQTPGKDGKRRTRFAVVRNTYPQLRDTTIKTVQQWLPPVLFGDYNKQDHNYLITGIDGLEIELMFRALDRPEHVSNLLSLELTGACVNEAREVPWAIVDALDGRINRYPPISEGGATRPCIILDTNPPDTDSDWYRIFEEHLTVDGSVIEPGYYELFKQPSGLSPDAENLPNLAKNYYQDLQRGKGRDFIHVYIKGEYGYVQEHRPVYSDYNDSVHCAESANVTKGMVVHRGWDFGLTPSCTFSQLLPSGHWVIFDEIVATEMGIEKFSERVLSHCGTNLEGYRFEDEADPAGNIRSQTDEKTCYQILKTKGIDAKPGKQDLTIRLESVRKPMNTLIHGKPQMQLHPRCKTLRKGFMGKYFFRRIHSGIGDKYSEVPEKNEYSHPHDALQYTATRLFGDSLTRKERPKGQPLPTRTNNRYSVLHR